MRGSLNLILESHQPQTQEWGIYEAYENMPIPPLASFSLLRGRNIGWEDSINRLGHRSEQVTRLTKKSERFNGMEQ